MKKVIALAVALMMALSLATFTFAAEAPTDDADAPHAVKDFKDGGTFEPGQEVVIEVEKSAEDKDLSQYSFSYELTEEGKEALEFVRFDGYKFIFRAKGDATTAVPAEGEYVEIIAKDMTDSSKVYSAYSQEVKVGYKTASTIAEVDSSTKLVKKSVFDELKTANEGATILRDLTVGPLTFREVTTSRDVNVSHTLTAPSAVKKALEGVNFAYVGFSYVQPLPGTAKLNVELTDELLLTNADSYFVYRISDNKFVEVAKNVAPDSGVVSVDVVATAQYIVTNKALPSNLVISGSGSNGSSSNNGGSSSNSNPGTGSSSMIGGAVVMAVVAMTAAGALMIKKVSK